MAWRKWVTRSYRDSAERGLRALHAKGKVTDDELADDVNRLRSGDDGETVTWVVDGAR